MARIAHVGQTYGGQDYFESHVTDVARRVEGDLRSDAELIAVAWLHDVLEDTAVVDDYLTEEGLTVRQHLALMALTRWEGEDYETYIARVVINRDACLVKLHDLESNIAAGPPIGKLAIYTGARERVIKALEKLQCEK